jgi:hypothetical protein
MLRNFHALKAFIGLFALFFAISNFATCSNEGSGPGITFPSSTSGYVPLPPAPPDSSIEVTVSQFNVGFTSSNQERLEIEFSASIIIADPAYESKFDSIRIMLADGTSRVLNTDNKALNKLRTFSWDKIIDVSDPALCGRTFKVAYEIYAKGNTGRVAAADIYKSDGTKADTEVDVTRDQNVGICRPSSSSAAPSSSSVVSKPFAFVGTATINANVGAMLATGQTAPAASADIHFMNSAYELRTQNNFKMMDVFYIPARDNCADFTAIDIPGNPTSVKTPTSTSQFIHCKLPGFNEETAYEYLENQYFLVKKGGTEWGPDWYLVMSETTGTATSTTGLELKIWKVN